MGRQRIERHATTTADPATVYALLRDGAGWPAWTPIESAEIERPGAEEPEGIGAVRLYRSGRVTGRDEIVELVPDRRFAYTHHLQSAGPQLPRRDRPRADRRRHRNPLGGHVRPQAAGHRSVAAPRP